MLINISAFRSAELSTVMKSHMAVVRLLIKNNDVIVCHSRCI